MASLDELPAALVGIILSYIPDAESLCRLECTCKTIRSVANNSSYWTGLYRREWALSKRPAETLNKAEYIRRYDLDKIAKRQVQNLSMLVQIPPPWEDDLMANMIVDLMNQGQDVIEGCRKIWESQRKEWEEEGRSDATYIRKCALPLAVLYFVHCSAVLDDLQQLCENGLDDGGLELEAFAIISSSMFYDLQKEAPETTTTWVRRELDNIAAASKAKLFQEHGDDEITPQQKLNCLKSVFFEDLEFSGNVDEYYNFGNSLLHTTLQRRKGIPMTLAVLFSLVGRRIGLRVEIIGLPGHIVCRIPDIHDRYIDVFRGGMSLRSRDCEVIVNSYGYRMLPEYLRALSPVHVFRRVLNNQSNCISQLPTELLPRLSVESMRTLASNPSEEQLEACRTWYAQAWMTHSSLILDEMLARGPD